VTFTASKTAKAGTATVMITGTSGSLKATTTIALTVNPLGTFILTAAPKTLTIERGNSGTSTITVTPKDMFDQSVTLSVIGMPKGVTVTFSPSSTTSTSTMTLAASPSAATGKYAITVTGVYGTLSHEAFVTLTVTK
jgi:VCBS repeat-containing protein